MTLPPRLFVGQFDKKDSRELWGCTWLASVISNGEIHHSQHPYSYAASLSSGRNEGGGQGLLLLENRDPHAVSSCPGRVVRLPTICCLGLRVQGCGVVRIGYESLHIVELEHAAFHSLYGSLVHFTLRKVAIATRVGCLPVGGYVV